MIEMHVNTGDTENARSVNESFNYIDPCVCLPQ